MPPRLNRRMRHLHLMFIVAREAPAQIAADLHTLLDRAQRDTDSATAPSAGANQTTGQTSQKPRRSEAEPR